MCIRPLKTWFRGKNRWSFHSPRSKLNSATGLYSYSPFHTGFVTNNPRPQLQESSFSQMYYTYLQTVPSPHLRDCTPRPPCVPPRLLAPPGLGVGTARGARLHPRLCNMHFITNRYSLPATPHPAHPLVIRLNNYWMSLDHHIAYTTLNQRL